MSILDDICGAKKEPDPREGLSWHCLMRDSNPGLYGELVDVIKDWLANGETRKKFPTITSLHRFLCGDDSNKLDPPVIDCGYQAFARFVRTLKR